MRRIISNNDYGRIGGKRKERKEKQENLNTHGQSVELQQIKYYYIGSKVHAIHDYVTSADPHLTDKYTRYKAHDFVSFDAKQVQRKHTEYFE